MQSILVSLNIVGPMFLLGFSGYLMRRLKLMDERLENGLIKLVFNLFLPAMLFIKVYNSDIAALSGRVVVYIACAITGLFFIYTAVICALEKENSSRSVIINGLLRGNTALFGVPLALGLSSDGDITVMMVATALVLILYNILSPVIYSIFSEKKQSVGEVIVHIISTPMLVACALGLVFALFKLPLPQILDSALTSLGNATTPIAFICLGSGLSLHIEKNNLRRLLPTVLFRLIITPAIMLAVAACLFGFRGQELVVVLAIFATPPAISSYPLAKAYNANHTLANEIVALATPLCILTLFGFIWALTALGLL